ncbi:MAG: 4Fe-4S binding protein [Gammaproteobacteria bacterium]|nr:4Fe-4S binding protein [Gammaproteobacteria bacterium]
MQVLTSPFISDPALGLDAIKGNTWSGNFFGYKISDPLAVVGQIASGLTIYWPFFVTGLIPIILTIIFGRFFCGWICPATFLYELNTITALWLQRLGIKTGKKRFNRKLKYLVLAIGVAISAMTGSVLISMIYPPAIIGREIYFGIALGGFGAGLVFFVLTLLFDLLVSRRGFCRYVCPGGALYSLLGRFRLFRIKRIVENCNDCAKCNAICEFGLDPLRDGFGQECNNCTACIAICPTDALTFNINIKDVKNQGPGHLGKVYKKSHS